MVSLTPRSDLYHFLAEALSEPPDWLALSGKEWPLYEAALQLAIESEAARQAVVAMLEISAEPIEVRRKRYASLFSGQGRPQVWVYESGALSGRLSSEVTWDVERWYQLAGIEIPGAELPDHASLELEFLAFLASAELIDFSNIERGFLQRHAGRWLPDLGRALHVSRDAVYGPIGQLLSDWMGEVNPRTSSPGHLKKTAVNPAGKLAVLPPERVEACSLCGFCVQRCPVKALRILEDQQTTRLQIRPENCIGCRKCVRVCDAGVLKMEEAPTKGIGLPSEWVTLRESPRITCQACGTPMVSLAEFQYVSTRLGHPAWLKLCQDCRPGLPGRE